MRHHDEIPLRGQQWTVFVFIPKSFMQPHRAALGESKATSRKQAKAISVAKIMKQVADKNAVTSRKPRLADDIHAEHLDSSANAVGIQEATSVRNAAWKLDQAYLGRRAALRKRDGESATTASNVDQVTYVIEGTVLCCHDRGRQVTAVLLTQAPEAAVCQRTKPVCRDVRTATGKGLCQEPFEDRYRVAHAQGYAAPSNTSKQGVSEIVWAVAKEVFPCDRKQLIGVAVDSACKFHCQKDTEKPVKSSFVETSMSLKFRKGNWCGLSQRFEESEFVCPGKALDRLNPRIEAEKIGGVCRGWHENVAAHALFRCVLP